MDAALNNKSPLGQITVRGLASYLEKEKKIQNDWIGLFPPPLLSLELKMSAAFLSSQRFRLAARQPTHRHRVRGRTDSS